MPEKQKPSLTKDKLAREVSYLLDIPFRPHQKYSGPAHKIVNIILNVVIDALAQGDSVFIPGFGTFEWYETPAHKSTLAFPHNGKPPTKTTTRTIELIPAKCRVIFKPSKVLQGIINDNMP